MDVEFDHAISLLIIGGLIGVAIIVKWGLRKTALPALIGYLILGFLLKATGTATGLLSEEMIGHLGFMADIGVFVLLFRVGLESDVRGLLSQIRRAQGIWVGNVLLSAVLGYITSAYVLGFSLIPSLYIAVAFTATSVAVPVAIWRESDALKSSNGELLLDVAEMDDISAILLMAILFAVVPALINHETESLVPTILATGSLLLLKLLLFGGFCYLFSRFAEHRLLQFFERIHSRPDSMIMLVATGFIFSAIAGLIGLSIALGAFFAGLMFSRDPETTTLSEPFMVLYELFTPFFFIFIGLQVDPLIVGAAVVPGLILLVAAVIGKFVGTVVPALRIISSSGAILLGVSMIPRAEISMIIMSQGRELGESVVPQDAFAAMVLVSIMTCLISPFILQGLLNRWPQKEHSED